MDNEPIVDRESSELSRIKSAFNEADSTDRFVVSVFELRQRPGQRDAEGWIKDVAVDELDNLRQTLSDEKGPGRYRCRVKKNGQPFRQYDLEIAALGRKAPTAPATPPTTDPALLAILERQDKLLALIAEKLATPAQPVQQQSTRDLIETLVALEKLRPPAPPANIAFEMFQKGLEFATKIAGSEKETGVLDLAREFIPAVMPALTKALAGQQPQQVPIERGTAQPLAPPILKPADAPVPPQVTNAPPAPATSTVSDYLLSQALAGTEPKIVADWMADNLPDTLLDQLEQAADPLEQLLTALPALGPHRNWTDAVLRHCFEDGDESLAGRVN